MRKKKESDEVVETGDLLAPYEATRVPSGAARTGLPSKVPSSPEDDASMVANDDPGPPRAAADPVIDLREAEPSPSAAGTVDRRFEPRFPLTVPAAADRKSVV